MAVDLLDIPAVLIEVAEPFPDSLEMTAKALPCLLVDCEASLPMGRGRCGLLGLRRRGHFTKPKPHACQVSLSISTVADFTCRVGNSMASSSFCPAKNRMS